MSVDKVIKYGDNHTTIQIRMPKNNQILSKTMLMKRHKRIEILYDENFGRRIDEIRRLFSVMISSIITHFTNMAFFYNT